LLLIDQHQFGYLTDIYSFCRYLRDDFDITCICWDYEAPRISMDGVRVRYVSRRGNKPVRLLRFLAAAAKEMLKAGYDITLIEYFQGCSLLRGIRPFRPTVVDIRTGSEHKNSRRRRLDNFLLRAECSLYRHITIISESLRRVLGFPGGRCHHLPLGGEELALPPKTFEHMRLFYVGTLLQRDLAKTVEGFDRFYREFHDRIDLHYDIVGDGPDHEQRTLREAIARSSCPDAVTYHGRIPFVELRPYLEAANFGVAFIPMTPYFHPQPSTKVFEYLLSGMPVLATATDENLLVMNDARGVVFEDTAEGFYEGLKRASERRFQFDSRGIMEGSRQYSWAAIVRENLRPYLLQCLQNHG
jgi:glycosyltransferase involved in cell wall biosynthesis